MTKLIIGGMLITIPYITLFVWAVQMEGLKNTLLYCVGAALFYTCVIAGTKLISRS